MTLVSLKERLNFISVYAFDSSKTDEEKETFYENLQNLLGTTATDDDE